MEGSDRRTFLKKGALLSAAAAGASGVGRAESPAPPGPEPAQERTLPPAVLRAVGEVVLPTEVSHRTREAAVAAFETWLAGYEPVPELSHGYGTSTIRYGPADPAPGWRAQLDALDLEARRSRGMAFADLGAGEREALVRAHVEASGDDALGDPLRARHVAVGLLAHWLESPAARDLAYHARIDAYGCRGLVDLPREPEGLGPRSRTGSSSARRPTTRSGTAAEEARPRTPATEGWRDGS